MAYMGIVVIHCPKTGKCISTGMYIHRAAFGSMPVFFGSTFCPLCRTSHEWFARNAWVYNPGPAKCDPGTVTLIGNLQTNDPGRNSSRCDCRLAPR